MRRFIHDKTSEGDGVFDGGESRYRPASPFWAVHDAGLHLYGPLLCEGRSTPRIEQGIGFQFSDLENEEEIFGLVI